MKVMIQAALLALAAPGLICLAQSADQQDVTAILKQRYVDQTLILRRAVDKNNHVYDSAGSLLTGGKDGPWTVYAGVRLRTLALSASELLMEGDRLEFAFDIGEKALAPVKSKQHIQLVVRLTEPLTTVDRGEALLHRVFALTDEDVIASVPEIWKPYLKKRAARKQDPVLEKIHAQSRWVINAADLAKIASDGAVAPKPVYTPEPEFSSFAKSRSLQGVVILTAVIDDSGKVLDPYITQPLGMGLDEKAIEAVRKWRFKPATRNGKPVKTEMALEIQFNLFN